MRVLSLACPRFRLNDRGRDGFIGCGRGWEATDDGQPPLCDRCGRAAAVTGSYSVADLRPSPTPAPPMDKA